MKKNQMTLHILAGGNAGGIETLCKDYASLSSLEHIFVFIWSGGPIAEEMKINGANIVILGVSKKNIFVPLQTLRRLCKEKNISSIVVHHAAPINYVYAMALKKEFRDIDIYIYAHGTADVMLRENKKGKSIRKAILKKAIKKSSGVIAISNSVKDSLIKLLGTSSDKITVIYNGTSLQNTNGSLHKIDNVPEIIYVGRLVKEKGVENTIKGLAKLSLPFHFTVVGDGPFRKELEKLTIECGLDEKVSFLGTRRDVKELLCKSDIFVHLPNCPEGFGITVIEAMSMGLCCICNNSGALPEIISNGIDGYIVNKSDEKQFINRINGALKHIEDKEMMKLRVNAMNSSKRFTSESFVYQLDQLLLKENT